MHIDKLFMSKHKGKKCQPTDLQINMLIAQGFRKIICIKKLICLRHRKVKEMGLVVLVISDFQSA